MTTDPHEAPGVEACCSDCASAVKREWNRVKVAKQKLAIQQERLTLDLQMLKVEKKKLKKNSRLAGKVPSGSDKTETYVGEQATETIPAKTDEMERNSSSPCVKCADKQIELQLMEDAAQLLKVELVQAREELEKEKRESKLTQSRQSNMYEDEVNGLHSSVEQLRRENEGLHAELQQLQEQKGISLAKELENDTRREREHGEMAKINEEKETAEALLEEQSRKLEDLQLLLPSNKAMLDQANAKCNRIQNKYDQLEAKYEDQQELIAELQATKEALVKRQQQQQQDLTELQRAQKEGRIVDIKTTANEYDESEAKDSSPRKHIVTASIPSDMRGETSQTKHVVEWEWTSATGLYGMYTGWLGISGTPDGHGTLRIEDGSIFDGEWRKGLREGKLSLFFRMSTSHLTKVCRSWCVYFN